MANAERKMTTNEIISMLARSQLPMIVVEGKDDAFIYNYLKKKLNVIIPLGVQPCGGRDSLFTVFESRGGFQNKKIVFIADKDTYVFDGVPEEKADIIFTEGYCIENDLYAGSGAEREAMKLMEEDEVKDFEKLKSVLIEWYAFMLQQYHKEPQQTLEVGSHLDQICPGSQAEIRMCSKFAEKIQYTQAQPCYLNRIRESYQLELRGKQLYQALRKVLSRKGRFSKHTEKNLKELSLKSWGNENEYLNKILLKIKDKLQL